MKKDALSPWICIARKGSFDDSNGKSHTFTDSDLENIAASYDPKQSEAPLVFGHPKDNAPAYGWVSKLKCENSKLFAQFAHVTDEVKEVVAQQRYKYVSMSLAKDKKRLLHVGLLGGAAPAIDGLGAATFSEEQGGITINFSDGGNSMNPEELQKRNGALEEQLKVLQAKYDKVSGEKGEADKAKGKAEGEAKSTAAEFAAFKNGVLTKKREERVQSLVASGKLKPAELQDSLSFAAALADVQTPVNFSAPDGKQEQVSAEERYFRELERREPDQRAMDFATQTPGHIATTQGAPMPVDITNKL